MSTLTKVLIVLLTVFSLFLCGIVVTYVANAENQRKAADDLKGSNRVSHDSQGQGRSRPGGRGRRSAKVEKDDLTTKLIALKRRSPSSRRTWTGQEGERPVGAEGREPGIRRQTRSAAASSKRALFQAAHQKVQSLEADRINREKELAETSQTLMEKMTIIAQLDEKVRQLTQENQDLGTRSTSTWCSTARWRPSPPTTVVAGQLRWPGRCSRSRRSLGTQTREHRAERPGHRGGSPRTVWPRSPSGRPPASGRT